jgi:hypothetical protein
MRDLQTTIAARASAARACGADAHPATRRFDTRRPDKISDSIAAG